ncbi:MAG: EVE domain-containing protein [Candidatus Nitrosopelagicus sp.]|jgi:predicted RNA-binding protein|nr:EVE domain-containing protein [Candidatus Nitrosopelagicus sp.]
MNRWIFVINDSTEEFENRVKTKQWPIYDRTLNRSKLTVGDSIIFYKAGSNGQKFIGNATIKTAPKKKSDFVYFLEMENISVWEKPIIIEEVIAKLDFIKNKNNWGSYFQGGVKAISDEGFSAIVQKTL